jgi:hypothetical protein
MMVRRRTGRRAAGALTAAGAVISIIFGGALLIATVTHPGLPRSLSEAVLTLLSIIALTACYAFGVCLSCRSFERAKSISYLASDQKGRPRGGAVEMLRGSCRPEVPKDEMLRATNGISQSRSDQLVRPNSGISEALTEPADSRRSS